MVRLNRDKRNTRIKAQGKQIDSDESDEEYKVGEDEEDCESDEYCSLDGDESDETLADFEEEDEEEVIKEEKKVKRVFRSSQQNLPPKKKSRNKKPPTRRKASYQQENDDDDDDGDYEYENDAEDEEDDEEFMLADSDLDVEDEKLVKEQNKKVSRTLQKKALAKGPRKSWKSKKSTSYIPRKRRRTRKPSTSKGAGVRYRNLMVEERRKKVSNRRKRVVVVDSDSDFVSSGSSDYDYTLSEEERELMRDAAKFCPDLNTSLRSSSLGKRKQQKEVADQQRKRPRRKGKEKVEEMKNAAGKQVCGICLSEEAKKTVRGSLDSCSHFFCFPCIMEWSKVESRCPLCKQRFSTISKPSKSNGGFNLRTVVIQVPERDQVYQPSEEELRGYLDPYENVICTECHEGGDDEYMLLCDICDSPAHSYCVGLGHEIPEGNWYCEGCRPTAFGSPNPQGLPPVEDHVGSTNIPGPSSPISRGIDLNAEYVPETPLTQEIRFSPPPPPPPPPPRRSVADSHAPTPDQRPGAVTLFERRRIQVQINNILNGRWSHSNDRSNEPSTPASGIRLFGSQLTPVRNSAPQRSTTLERPASTYTFQAAENSPTMSMRNRDMLSPGPSNFGRQGQNSSFVSANGLSPAERGGFGTAVGSRLCYETLHPCNSRLTVGSDGSPSPYACRETMIPSRTSQNGLRTPY